MEQNRATHAFATLGHPGRLAVFRLLMRFAPQGVRPTEIADALGLKQNTLSHHLTDLTASGLACVTRQGRSLFYSVDLDTAEALIGYLALDVGRARPDLLAPLTFAQKETAMRATDFNVLFICSGNSARSIFAEALLRDLGKGKFQAFSAGTRPNSELNPFALEILKRNGHDTSSLRSKHVSEFQQPELHHNGFCLHRLRHRRRRGMSALAGPADHGSLGPARPCQSDRNRCRKGAGLRPNLCRPAPPDHELRRTAFRVVEPYVSAIPRR